MRTILSLLLLTLFSFPITASAKAPTPSDREAPKGKLVFVAMTGLEDIGTLSSSFRHALAAKQSGYLEDVVWLIWGRAVVALDPTVSAVPDDVRKQAEAAKEAGVQLVACGQALKKWGIDPQKLTPQAKVVANGVDELARLVSQGYQVIRY